MQLHMYCMYMCMCPYIDQSKLIQVDMHTYHNYYVAICVMSGLQLHVPCTTAFLNLVQKELQAELSGNWTRDLCILGHRSDRTHLSAWAAVHPFPVNLCIYVIINTLINPWPYRCKLQRGIELRIQSQVVRTILLLWLQPL